MFNTYFFCGDTFAKSMNFNSYENSALLVKFADVPYFLKHGMISRADPMVDFPGHYHAFISFPPLLCKITVGENSSGQNSGSL